MDAAEARRRAGVSTPPGHAGGHASMWASGVPETRYAKSDDGYIAYQVFGEGPNDLLFIGNWASNVETSRSVTYGGWVRSARTTVVGVPLAGTATGRASSLQ